MHCMRERSCICCLLITWRHTFYTDKLVTHSSLVPCYDDTFQQFCQPGKWRVRSYCQCLSIDYAKLGGRGILCQFPCALTMLWPSFSFQTCGPVYIKYDFCPPIISHKNFNWWIYMYIFGCIFLKCFWGIRWQRIYQSWPINYDRRSYCLQLHFWPPELKQAETLDSREVFHHH